MISVGMPMMHSMCEACQRILYALALVQTLLLAEKAISTCLAVDSTAQRNSRHQCSSFAWSHGIQRPPAESSVFQVKSCSFLCACDIQALAESRAFSSHLLSSETNVQGSIFSCCVPAVFGSRQQPNAT